MQAVMSQPSAPVSETAGVGPTAGAFPNLQVILMQVREPSFRKNVSHQLDDTKSKGRFLLARQKTT